MVDWGKFILPIVVLQTVPVYAAEFERCACIYLYDDK